MVRKKSQPNPKAKKNRIANKTQDKTKSKVAPKANASLIKKKKPQQFVRVLVQHLPSVQPYTRKMYKEIRRLQITTQQLIPRLPFQRIVREIMEQFVPRENYRIQTEALRALQEAAEMYMTQYFEDAYFCCLHAKRKTLFASDMQCVRRLRGRTDIVNH